MSNTENEKNKMSNYDWSLAVRVLSLGCATATQPCWPVSSVTRRIANDRPSNNEKDW